MQMLDQKSTQILLCGFLLLVFSNVDGHLNRLIRVSHFAVVTNPDTLEISGRPRAAFRRVG